MAEAITLYKVTRVIPRTEITPEGEFELKHEIFFITKSGIADSVVVAKDIPKEERDRILTEAARRIEETMTLKR